MKIDMEQFLAMTVALGAAGAVGFAVYTDRAEMNEVIAGVEAVEEPVAAESEPSLAEEVAAAVIAPAPMPAEPADADEAAGIPPVIPDDESDYGPGPTSEMAKWE